jgi:hypothetical protein
LLLSDTLHCAAEIKIQYPMMFRVTNPLNSSRFTHCGVQEFTSRPGTVLMPHWVRFLSLSLSRNGRGALLTNVV